MAIVLSGTTGIDAGSLPVANTGKISAGSGLPAILNTAGVDRVTVDTSGNVGIGTSTPAVSLDLSARTDAIALPSGTTAQRPATPLQGALRYNNTLEALEMYDGSKWTIVKSVFAASGGTVTDIPGYRVHVFNSSGTFTVSKGTTEVEYLIIAGGAGAAGSFAGGGGAGGYRSSVAGEFSGGQSTAESKYTVVPGSYSVVVGAGGAGGNAGLTDPRGANGSNSSVFGIVALGGGTSGSYKNFTTYSYGTAGGSGGGGGSSENSTTYAGGAGTTGQGFAGGYGLGRNGYVGGGGGGAGAVGQDAIANTKAGNGGSGLSSAITGSSVTRAGGGGGAGYYYANGVGDGAGGGGGGGAGNSVVYNATGYSGAANTGGGGGGGGFDSGIGGAGGSGVVIIRYKI